MMIMLARLVVGLLVLKVAAASPTRHARQVELDTYDSNNYDVGMNLENQDVYDYYDGVTIDEPQIEIGTLAPPEESAVGEEEGEEAEETEAEEVEEVDEAEGEEGEEVEEVDAEEAEAEEGEEVDVEEVEAEEVDVEQFDAEEPVGEEEYTGEEYTEELYPEVVEEEYVSAEVEIPIKPQLIPAGGSGGSGQLMGPDSQGGMSTCMLCTCLGGSVYCDDVKLQSVPPLPKDTTHFYARYNKITKINKSDFANMNKLKRIDLTSNEIGRVDDDAFFGLPALQELVVRENRLVHLPALPASMTLIDASINKLGSTGIQKEAFKDMAGLLYLYLTDNNIDYVPVPLPDSLRSLHLQNNNIQMLHEDTFCNVKDLHYIRYALEDVRLDGNPLNLSRTPHAYVCLPRIPIGALI